MFIVLDCSACLLFINLPYYWCVALGYRLQINSMVLFGSEVLILLVKLIGLFVSEFGFRCLMICCLVLLINRLSLCFRCFVVGHALVCALIRFGLVSG